MSKFSDEAEKFSGDKKTLDPVFKPLANVPTNITRVRSIKATRATNPDGDEYAVFKIAVDVEGDDGVLTKEWNISSETLVETLKDKGVDVGSSFTVLKTGEGFHTKYQVSNVVNPTTQTSLTGEASA